MSAVPQGAFATLKIKQNWQKPNKQGWNGEQKSSSFSNNELSIVQPPLKYNSKLMNSVWGLYNQYSVHNFKRNSDSVKFNVFNHQRFRMYKLDF